MRCHVGNGAALLLDTASTADYPSVIRDLFFSRWCRLSSSRLDYGNSTLASVSSHLLSRLQSVMNAATRLIFSSSRFQHITPLLRQLHWLKAPEHIAFKQSVLDTSCTSVCTGPHLYTLLTSFVRWQMSRLVSDSVPVHLHH